MCASRNILNDLYYLIIQLRALKIITVNILFKAFWKMFHIVVLNVLLSK